MLLKSNDKYCIPVSETTVKRKLSIVLNCLENKLLWESVIFLSLLELLNTVGKHAVSNK